VRYSTVSGASHLSATTPLPIHCLHAIGSLTNPQNARGNLSKLYPGHVYDLSEISFQNALG